MFIISERITIEILDSSRDAALFHFSGNISKWQSYYIFFQAILLHIQLEKVFCVNITCTFCNICITLLLKIYGTFFNVYLFVSETHKSLTVVLASMRKIWAPFVQLLDLKNLVCMLLTLLRKGLCTWRKTIIIHDTPC